MKRKELKNIAKKIYSYEMSRLTDPLNASIYEGEIIRLSGLLQDFEDIIEVDLMVQEMIAKNS